MNVPWLSPTQAAWEALVCRLQLNTASTATQGKGSWPLHGPQEETGNLGSSDIFPNVTHLAQAGTSIIGIAEFILLLYPLLTLHIGPVWESYMLSCFSRVWFSVTLWTLALLAPLSMGFSRQRYWSGLLFPPPGDLPHPGIKSESPASPALAGRFFTTRATRGARET